MSNKFRLMSIIIQSFVNCVSREKVRHCVCACVRACVCACVRPVCGVRVCVHAWVICWCGTSE